MFTPRQSTSRLTCLALEVQEFQFEVQYVQGHTHVLPDALSRQEYKYTDLSVDQAVCQNVLDSEDPQVQD